MAKPLRFDTGRAGRKRRRTNTRARSWRRIPAWLVIAVAAGAIGWFVRQQGNGEIWVQQNSEFTLCENRASSACVIDGDTIMIGKRKIRMSGYNAPELAGECSAEKSLALESRGALLQWLNAGPFLMSGGDEPPFDKYGRELREFRRGNDWLADAMIRGGLAQQSGWGFVHGGWCG